MNRKYFAWGVPPRPRQEPRHSRAKLTWLTVSGWPGRASLVPSFFFRKRHCGLGALRAFAATTWTLTPRFFAATRARAIVQSLKDHVAILMVPALGEDRPLASRRAPQVLLMVISTRLRIANFAFFPALGKLK